MFVLDCIKAYAKTGRDALINRDKRLSFADLDARSEAFAAYLKASCSNKKTPVLIYGHKETDFLPCIYGSLKAGRAYVPVDTAMPVSRAKEIAEDVGPCVIVDFSESLKADAAVLGPKDLDVILSKTQNTETPASNWVSGEDAAYILFTSGSTGKPKGVPITVKNLTSFYNGLTPYIEASKGGVILNQISYSFDVSCCSIFAGISMGMTLFTVDKDMAENTGMLFKYLKESSLSLWVSTPSFAEICVSSGMFAAELMPELRCFLFCGEVLTRKLCDRLTERFPNARIVNTYGPTEATVLVTAAEITEEMRLDQRSIPIGRPIDGVCLRIVDKNGEAIEKDGVFGELLIIGDSVGPCYYNRPDLKSERFFEDEATGKRGYRTGDICCRENGLYYYQGRADNQIKLHGFRVEPEDIENNLTRLENISRAAVIPVWDEGRAQYLAAFILMERKDGLSPLKRAIHVKKQAAAYLPSYMIPRRIIAVDAFPLNSNGKIDKKALALRLTEAGRP